MKTTFAITGAGISVATIGTWVSIVAGVLTIIFVSWQLYDKWEEHKQRKAKKTLGPHS